MMGDRRVSRNLKGKVFTSCGNTAYVYGETVETIAQTEKNR